MTLLRFNLELNRIPRRTLGVSTMKHGSERVRLVDIAAQAGVSATVVSAVLRGGSTGTVRAGREATERVRNIAKRLNYRPNLAAQLLKGRPSDVIAVLIGAASTAANHERLAALEQAAYERGRRLMVGHFHDDPERTSKYIEDFLSRGIDALICFHNPAPNFDARGRGLLRGLRGVVFQTQRLIPGACCVDVDRAAGVRQAISHLVERGRKRIALVLNSSPEQDSLMEDRRRGYVAGLEAAAREVGARLIWCGSGIFPPTAALLQAGADALTGAYADAVIASNDVWAMGLMKMLRRDGRRVPEDIAVIGFDNLPAAELFDPALTSIDQNNKGFAEAALTLLTQVLERPDWPRKLRSVTVQPRLVVRESA